MTGHWAITLHWSRNIFFFMKFSSLAALEVVKMTTISKTGMFLLLDAKMWIIYIFNRYVYSAFHMCPGLHRMWEPQLPGRFALESKRICLVYSQYPRVTLYTAGHLHTAVPHCSHSLAPIVHTAVPRENNEHGCVYLRCRAVCKLPGCVEGHPWYHGCWWHCDERSHGISSHGADFTGTGHITHYATGTMTWTIRLSQW